MTPQPRLLARVRERVRLKHYSIRTEQAYVDWIQVVGRELEWLGNVERAKRRARVPVVLTKAECGRSWRRGTVATPSWRGSSTAGSWSACACGYKEVAFGLFPATVRDGKGEKDRGTILPALLQANLLAHLERVKAVHQKDLEEGFGEGYLPFALARKYPRAGRAWG